MIFLFSFLEIPYSGHGVHEAICNSVVDNDGLNSAFVLKKFGTEFSAESILQTLIHIFRDMLL